MEQHPERLTAEEVATLSALYDAEIATWDAAFGDLWTALRARGRDRDTVIVVTADHGEEFRDHGGLEHGHTLYEEQLRIPLIVRLPNGAGGGGHVDALVRSTDVAPTLGALAAASPTDGRGAMLLPLPEGPPAPRATEPAFAATEFGRRSLVAVVLPPWKVILPPPGSPSDPEVYDLQRDPAETRNLAASHPVLVAYARQELAATQRLLPRSSPVSHEAPIAPEVMERLRALGYAVE
jgi:arylsulfatase A-like enzyme